MSAESHRGEDGFMRALELPSAAEEAPPIAAADAVAADAAAMAEEVIDRACARMFCMTLLMSRVPPVVRVDSLPVRTLLGGWRIGNRLLHSVCWLRIVAPSLRETNKRKATRTSEQLSTQPTVVMCVHHVCGCERTILISVASASCLLGMPPGGIDSE